MLLVDDNPDLRNVLAFEIGLHGAQVATAGSVAEAMRLFLSGHPDVVISDLNMPVEDGYGLIRGIRSLDPSQGNSVPAIALTAYGYQYSRERSLAAGFQDHFVKPADVEQLVKKLAVLLGRE